MIMLIENPLQLWKHLNAKVKNSWMERIVVHKRLFREITKIARAEESVGVQNADAELKKASVHDPSSIPKSIKKLKSELDFDLKPPEIFVKQLLIGLRKPSPVGGFESFLRRSILQNINVADPYKILEKATFKGFVKNLYKQYFVNQVYNPNQAH